MVVSLRGVPVVDMPDSGTGQELLAWAGIDAGHIAAAAHRLADLAGTQLQAIRRAKSSNPGDLTGSLRSTSVQ